MSIDSMHDYNSSFLDQKTTFYVSDPDVLDSEVIDENNNEISENNNEVSENNNEVSENNNEVSENNKEDKLINTVNGLFTQTEALNNEARNSWSPEQFELWEKYQKLEQETLRLKRLYGEATDEIKKLRQVRNVLVASLQQNVSPAEGTEQV